MPSLEVAEFIAHLCIRTKHLRDSLRESSAFLIEKMSEYLFESDNRKAFISNNPHLIESEIDKIIEQYPVIEPFRNMILTQGVSMVLAVLEQSNFGIQSLIQQFIEQGRIVLPRAVKEGHIKALAKSLVPEPRAEEYRLLQWFVRRSLTPLVLGDFGCLFETFGSRRFKSINDKDDQIKNIFLPISSDRLLVGTSLSSIPEIDPDQVNEAIAKCSREFFVCSETSSTKTDLIMVVGKESEIISEAEVEQLMKEVAEEIRAQPNSNSAA